MSLERVRCCQFAAAGISVVGQVTTTTSCICSYNYGNFAQETRINQSAERTPCSNYTLHTHTYTHTHTASSTTNLGSQSV